MWVYFKAHMEGEIHWKSTILTLMAFIARLQAVDEADETGIHQRFRAAIGESFPSHALLRETAGRAFASTATAEEALSLALEALEHSNSSTELNARHSLLLRTQCLLVLSLQSSNIKSSASSAKAFASRLYSSFTDLSQEIGDDYILGTLLNVTRTTTVLLNAHGLDDSEHASFLRNLCQSGLIHTAALRPPALHRDFTFVLLDNEPNADQSLLRLLEHPSPSAREAALKYMAQNVQQTSTPFSTALGTTLHGIASDARHAFTERCVAISILIGGAFEGHKAQDLHDGSEVHLDLIADILWEAWDTPCVPLRESLLQYASSRIASPTDQLLRLGLPDIFRLLAELISRTSDEEESVESRLAAIQSIKHLAPFLFDATLVQALGSSEPLAADFLQMQLVVMRMVEDDDEDVRLLAAQTLLQSGSTSRTAKQHAVAWLQAQYGGAEVTRSIGSHLERGFKTKTALFAVDQPNQFRDGTFDVLLAARCLTKHPLRQDLVRQDIRQVEAQVAETAEALTGIQHRPEVGDGAARYVLGLRLALAARVLQGCDVQASSTLSENLRGTVEFYPFLLPLGKIRRHGLSR
ncbi:hypothetical protein V8E36_006147 [Tilletia maclaganii]